PRLLETLRPSARALRREGWIRDAAGGEGNGRGDQEGGQAVGDPHLPRRGSRVLQRRAARRVQQGGRRRRLAAHARALPAASQVVAAPRLGRAGGTSDMGGRDGPHTPDTLGAPRPSRGTPRYSTGSTQA